MGDRRAAGHLPELDAVDAAAGGGLHRSLLIRQLEEIVAQDARTGLLTDREWQHRAAGELARATHIAERIRHAITCLDVPVELDEHTTLIRGLSASIGVATYPDAGHAIDRLVHAADTAMYRAKTNGRNQVVSVLDL